MKDKFWCKYATFSDDMKRLLLIIYISFVSACAIAQHITFMSLNCENAFDARHDEGKNDYEYLTDGTRRWSMKRLYKKLDGIAKVIAATDTEQPVGIVALCEVENDSVLEYLTKRTVLRSLGYKYVITDSPDTRGVDVAILYSHLAFMPIDVEYLRPDHVGTPTRDILHVSGVSHGDTLDVYAVHLPSKLGGKESQQKGMQVAGALKANIGSIMSRRTNAKIFVMGDFNADMRSSVMNKALSAEDYWQNSAHVDTILYDVVEGTVGKGMGSYKYRGVWSVIDHILVSGNVDVLSAGVLSNDALLEEDTKYGGKKPRRTYVGFKYNGGISDHLPVWVKIRW